MLISEYLQLRNISSAVTTGSAAEGGLYGKTNDTAAAQSAPFAEELKKQLEANTRRDLPVSEQELSEKSSVRFSKHAIERINERGIDLYSDDRLERLNKAVSLAEEKGSGDALIFIDSAAFLVSVKNNRVITTVNTEEMTGNIFTNIDSTVIM